MSLPNYDVKLLKPQNILEMLHIGSRDIGFAGADWVREVGGCRPDLLTCRQQRATDEARAPGAPARISAGRERGGGA